jgi:hypothetical protein
MSSTQDLQNFIQLRSIRSPGESPQDRQAAAKKREQDKGEDVDAMIARNIQDVKDIKAASQIAAAREGMANAMGDKLREDKVLPKPTGEVAMMKEGGGGGAGGAGGAGGLAGGGTVAVASDPGVFTNTYGGDSKRRLGMKKKPRKKDKKDKSITSGVTKADRFLRGEEVNQSRKSVQDFAKWVIEEARMSMLQLDARPENVNTNEIDEPPVVANKKSGTPRNHSGRRGKQGLSPGQQGYTRPQYSHHFIKMKAISKALNSDPSVLSLLKALDTDVPIGVN